MAMILYDRKGNEVSYENVETITTDTTDAEQGATFTYGEAIEGAEYEPNFADGDHVVTLERGQLLKKFKIKKPKSLVPENVAKDKVVCGVVGTLQAGGGGSVGDYTVTVIDYDGTVLLEEKHTSGDVVTLPDAPTHERIVFDGWSASVDIVDGTVAVAGNDIMIGAMYTTASGATEVDIIVSNVSGLTFTFNSVLTGYTSIDWGDGTIDTSISHTYATIGEYTIKIYGMTSIGSSNASTSMVGSSYRDMVKSIFLSNDVTTIGAFAFTRCYALATIVIPRSVTKVNNGIFYYCYSLTTVVIPQSITSIGDNAFNTCYALINVVIPQGITSIGNTTFNNCYALATAIIPQSVVSIGSSTFANCYALTNVVIPQGITSIGESTFNKCYSLTNVVIPQSVTSIGSLAFCNCYSLTAIVIPQNVISIGEKAFYGCQPIKVYDFSEHLSIPTLNSSVFYGILTMTKIKVPASLYSTWIVATNWSTYANYIVAV